jgi:hypothetical protein
VCPGYDSAKNETFYRLIGGTVEFREEKRLMKHYRTTILISSQGALQSMRTGKKTLEQEDSKASAHSPQQTKYLTVPKKYTQVHSTKKLSTTSSNMEWKASEEFP